MIRKLKELLAFLEKERKIMQETQMALTVKIADVIGTEFSDDAGLWALELHEVTQTLIGIDNLYYQVTEKLDNPDFDILMFIEEWVFLEPVLRRDYTIPWVEKNIKPLLK